MNEVTDATCIFLNTQKRLVYIYSYTLMEALGILQCIYARGLLRVNSHLNCTLDIFVCANHHSYTPHSIDLLAFTMQKRIKVHPTAEMGIYIII